MSQCKICDTELEEHGAYDLINCIEKAQDELRDEAGYLSASYIQDSPKLMERNTIQRFLKE